MLKAPLIIFTIVITMISCGVDHEGKYTREQCIFRVNIKWDKYEGDKEMAIRRVMDNFRAAPDMGFNKVPPSAAVQGKNRQYIYYQLTDGCENRIENARKLLSFVLTSREKMPALELDSGSFSPGVDTIRVTGEWWRDENSRLRME